MFVICKDQSYRWRCTSLVPHGMNSFVGGHPETFHGHPQIVVGWVWGVEPPTGVPTSSSTLKPTKCPSRYPTGQPGFTTKRAIPLNLVEIKCGLKNLKAFFLVYLYISFL